MLLLQVADKMEKEKAQLVDKIARKLYSFINSYSDDRMPIKESRETMETTLGYIIEYLRNSDSRSALDEEKLPMELIHFEEGIASRRVKYHIPLKALLNGINIFHQEIWDLIFEELNDQPLPSPEFRRLQSRIDGFINSLIILVSDSYIKSKENLIRDQQTALMRWEEVVKSTANIELKIPCREEFAAIVRMQAEAIARRLKYSEEEIMDFTTAVGEACDNAIEHGCSPRGVDVHYHLSREELVVEIIDYGKGFDPKGKGEESPDPFAERGRGIFLMKNFVDRVELYSKKGEGTMVILAKKRIFK